MCICILQSPNAVYFVYCTLLLLQWIFNGAKQPSKIAPSLGVSGPPHNAWFLGFTQVHNSNGTSIGSSIFVVASRPQIDHDSKRLYLCILCMRCSLMWTQTCQSGTTEKFVLLPCTANTVLYSSASVAFHWHAPYYYNHLTVSFPGQPG